MRMTTGILGRTLWRQSLGAVLALQLALTGCSTPKRLPAVPSASTALADTGITPHSEAGPIRFLVTRETQSFADEARSSLRKEQAYLARTGRQGELPPVAFLAISGGGDNGAFASGLLSGWTASGTRPDFKAVTGISTGALIAPFAFLGPKYDSALEAVYTKSSPKDIFKKRGFLSGFFSDGLADTTPLARLLDHYVNQTLLDEIAAEYAKGRLLLVGTTNLDTLEPVIWNMTAIAASHDPQAAVLFRRILLASASIPGVFPPVMIDVTIGGTHYQEMHVDGGTVAQVFLYPPSLRLGASAPQRQRTVYIIRNARLDADWASVERRVLPIVGRAISSLLQTQSIGDLYRIYVTTQRDGLDYNLAFIPSSFTVPHREEFDTNYMQQLYATGRDMSVKGYPWQKYPPGYEGPVRDK